MRFPNLVLTWVLLTLVLQLPAYAQTSTEDCTGQPSLDGDDTFGFVKGPTPTSDAFAMTGTGRDTWDPTNCGFNDGFDRVVCFTPTNNCDVLFEVATDGWQWCGGSRLLGYVWRARELCRVHLRGRQRRPSLKVHPPLRFHLTRLWAGKGAALP